MSRSETKTLSQGMEVTRLRSALQDHKAQAVAERDADRGAIARELHDKFGQYLTVMELELGIILERADLAPQMRGRLHKMRSLTAEAQQDVADMAWQIRPATLQGMDLKTACEQLTAEWSSRSNISFDLHLSPGQKKPPEMVETTLYRILQEAITNAVKHANATKIGIILRAVSREAILIVEDNGSGFSLEDSGAVSPLSLGLLGIRERLALVGGSLEIESSPGRGTTLLVSVPL